MEGGRSGGATANDGAVMRGKIAYVAVKDTNASFEAAGGSTVAHTAQAHWPTVPPQRPAPWLQQRSCVGADVA